MDEIIDIIVSATINGAINESHIYDRIEKIKFKSSDEVDKANVTACTTHTADYNDGYHTVTIVPENNNQNTTNYWAQEFNIQHIPQRANQHEDDLDFVKMSNSKYFNNYNVRSTLNGWTIDGVCAIGKTSSVRNIRKTNHALSLIAHNTHPSSALGYTFTQLKMQCNDPSSVWDRNAFNNYLWLKIWQCIGQALSNNESRISLETLKHAYDQLHPDTLHLLAKLSRNIILVDSNELRSILRLNNRNEGSDQVRSQWMFYIQVQNYFYARLATDFPQYFVLIDVDWFDGSLDRVQAVIRKIIYESEDAIDNKPVTLNENVFIPLAVDCKKSILGEEGEDRERWRPIQTITFTNGAKRIVPYIRQLKQKTYK